MKQIDPITIIGPDTAEMRSLEIRIAEELESYRIPRDVKRRTGLTGLKDVKEPWLIVLCSPDTPKDPGVQKAIGEFTARGLYHRILTLLADGTPDSSFPDALLHETLEDGTVVEHEPLAANIAGQSGVKREKALKVEKLRLLAPMLGVSFDELRNRQGRKKRQILTVLGAAVILAAAAFLVVTLQRVRVFREQNEQLQVQYDRAEAALADTQKKADEAAREYASAIAEEAEDLLKTGDSELAMLLCLELLPERADVPEVPQVLASALEQRGGAGYVPITVTKDAAGEQMTQEAWDTALQGTILPEKYGMEWRREISAEGYLLYVYGEEKLCIYDPAGGQTIGSVDSIPYPLYAADVTFAGETGADGRRGAERILCGNVLYEFRQEKTPVPENLDEQISLAREYLGNRELTAEEMNYYRIESLEDGQ